MLPVYILGNLHCIGMCGPLVMMIGRHRFRYFYFLGRLLSFTLAGFIAGGVGSVLNVFFQEYYISAVTSFAFGLFILSIGCAQLFSISVPIPAWAGTMNRSVSLLMLKDQPFATFLFGFFTIALPCGQTLIVYSACAIYGNPFVGMLNGFLFALITSPSLFLAMKAHGLLNTAKKYYSPLMGFAALLIGSLAICRGLAELNLIPHLVLNRAYHIVIY